MSIEKSSGIPYFCGDRIAHSAQIKSMEGTVQPIVKVYPRNIGAVIKGGGIVSKTMQLECRIMPPAGTSRGDVEEFMNQYNELYGQRKGVLAVDNNTFTDVAINHIKYDPAITSSYIIANIDFALGMQVDASMIINGDDRKPDFKLDTRQLTPSRLFADTRGRPGVFTVVSGTGTSKKTSKFHIWHNMDITKDLENRLILEIYDVWHKDQTIKFNGGFETITAYCWMKAPELTDAEILAGRKKEDGWLQTVSAYIYNMMNGPLGAIGTLELGGKTIEHCLWTQVKLSGVWETSARFELTFIVSLQC